jgi:hypothetical protein
VVRDAEIWTWTFGDPVGTRKVSWITRFEAALRGFAALPEDWNDNGAAKISPVAIQTAQSILEILWTSQLRPVRIAPTADGGIMLTLPRAKGLATIECLESGVVFVAMPVGQGVYDTFELQNIEEIASDFERDSLLASDRSPAEDVLLAAGG